MLGSIFLASSLYRPTFAEVLDDLLAIRGAVPAATSPLSKKVFKPTGLLSKVPQTLPKLDGKAALDDQQRPTGA